MEVTERILEKIKKLLSLSKNNPSKEEAMQAALKAQELLAQYDLSEDDLNFEKNDRTITYKNYHTGTDRSYKYELVKIVGRNFRTKPLWVGKKNVRFFGYPMDVEASIEVFNYLFTICEKNANRERARAKRELGTTAGVYFAYTRGFLDGVASKLDEQCKALMLVVPEEAINEHWKELGWKITYFDTKGRLGDSEPGADIKAMEKAFINGKREGRDAVSARGITSNA